MTFASPAVTATRLDTIHRAVDLIDSTDPATLQDYLSWTTIHDHVKADPAALRDSLAAVTADSSTGRRFGAWKAAQQILQAAGRPF